MKVGALVILIATLFLFAGNVPAQDYNKMNKLHKKLQELLVQHQNCKDETTANQIFKEIQAITSEMREEGKRLEKEILPKVEEFEKSLPPTLKKISDLEKEINALEEDLISNAVEINEASKEIIKLMGDLYLNEDKIATDLTSFIVSLKFCKKVVVNFETKGRGSNPGHFEVSYDIKMPINAYWTADYLVDVIKRKGYLHSHTIKTVKSESDSVEMKVISLSGWKQVIRPGMSPTTGPIDRYVYKPGVGSITLGPAKAKEFDFNDPSTWPDEIVSEYMLGYTPPFVTFLSSQDQVEEVGIPIPCMTNLENLTYITPGELNKGIREGTYSKVITKDTFFPNCDESTITLSIDFPNLLCDQHADKGALATADACIDHGGYVLATEDHVFAHGKPVARVGDHALCLRHGITEIVGDKDVKVYSDEQRIARVGDKTKCGAIIMGGSFNVYAGER
ncbi:MAG: hypothetical protein HKM87_07575 [Ignavibacteriaceae bacterium]|nr:hypothetical protein [Ignavibacteriaceae bacterium]